MVIKEQKLFSNVAGAVQLGQNFPNEKLSGGGKEIKLKAGEHIKKGGREGWRKQEEGERSRGLSGKGEEEILWVSRLFYCISISLILMSRMSLSLQFIFILPPPLPIGSTLVLIPKQF